MGYFEPSREDFNYLKHLVLVGGNTDEAWTKDDFAHYLTHLDANGNADDWMFDAFALWHFKSPKGGFLYSDINIGTTRTGEGDFYAVPAPNPGNKEDWISIMDWYFQPNIFIDALEQAVVDAEKNLGSRDHKVNLVITIPYPGPYQTQFGEVAGEKLNFSTRGQNRDEATRQRLKACVWFVEEIIRRFEEKNYEHINLLGFYWTFETVYKSWDMDDHWLLKELRKEINSRGQKFFWIPFWSSYNAHLLEDYQNYYFDCAFLQPNHMFYENIEDVDKAAEVAKRCNAGIEMEFYASTDEVTRVVNERFERFDRYLDGGIKYGYMKDSACAWFDGGKAIYRLYHHSDPEQRKYYDKIYEFIKGVYA